MTVVAFVLTGFLIGIVGGLFGVGGGEIFIPVLIYLYGFSQHNAQGTSLAILLPPIGLLAALRYYRAGHVDFGVAMLLAVGFFFGASIGAIVATRLHADILRRLFGVFLLLVALHMTFGHHGK
ncbi:MAG: sulfite exporter TauE/SafE family protein [Acidobacteria bacterium]|nr:sulfite exporter TauE/SafE family protein [Acidobacteriota bacterium]